MGVPYEITPVFFSAVQNEETVVPVVVPSRTRIHKLIVKEVGGNTAAFTVDIYNNSEAAQGNDNIDSEGHHLPPEIYKVAPTFTGAAGIMEYFSNESAGGAGLCFFNMDDQGINKTQNKRILYLVISLTSANTTFAISMGLDSDLT